jgi:hypothetical protein
MGCPEADEQGRDGVRMMDDEPHGALPAGPAVFLWRKPFLVAADGARFMAQTAGVSTFFSGD